MTNIYELYTNISIIYIRNKRKPQSCYLKLNNRFKPIGTSQTKYQ